MQCLTNLVETMPKRQLWEKIQKDDPVLADLLIGLKREFGKVDLVEYVGELGT